jgi:hypothetical protein
MLDSGMLQFGASLDTACCMYFISHAIRQLPAVVLPVCIYLHVPVTRLCGPTSIPHRHAAIAAACLSLLLACGLLVVQV